MDAGQAIEADWKPGNIKKRLAADATVGREQNGEQTLGYATMPNPVS
jgi:hypothetical protein